MPLLEYLLPQYVAEGKAHLSVAIGCTGGRHRSVAIAEQLAARFREAGEYFVEVAHRDIDRVGTRMTRRADRGRPAAGPDRARAALVRRRAGGRASSSTTR